MNNEEFQKLVLEKLETLENGQNKLEDGQKKLEDRQRNLESSQETLQYSLKDLKDDFKNMKVRQDEIYQVVRAIEHSNQTGKSEMDSQNIRLAKVEGRLKKAAKAFNDDVDIEKASNL